MTVKRLEPQGFCGGVKYALMLLDSAIAQKDTPRPIYLIGNIIHNKIVMNEYKMKGVIILNAKGRDKLEIIDQIDSGTVIFSAHGTDERVIQRAKDKGLNVIDTVCPNVKIIHNRIKKFLQDGYDVVYIGSKGHPECEGVLAISPRIHLISSREDLDNLSLENKNIYVTNQTTLSLYDLEHVFNDIKEKYPTSIIDNKICTATTERQRAVMNQDPVDLCIIVGDKLSSNSNKLFRIAKENSKMAMFCEAIADLDLELCKKANTISITSGASTPDYIVDEIVEKIEELNK